MPRCIGEDVLEELLDEWTPILTDTISRDEVVLTRMEVKREIAKY